MKRQIMEVTLNLPENVYLNFSKLAEKKHRRLEEVIADKLQDDFSAETDGYEETVAGWTDEAVLALAKLKIPAEYAGEMSVLPERLDDGNITASEKK